MLPLNYSDWVYLLGELCLVNIYLAKMPCTRTRRWSGSLFPFIAPLDDENLPLVAVFVAWDLMPWGFQLLFTPAKDYLISSRTVERTWIHIILHIELQKKNRRKPEHICLLHTHTHTKKMHADATNLFVQARDKLSRPGYTNRDIQQRFNKQRLRKIIAAFYKLPI